MKRVAVLRGGPSEEYEVSLKSGQAVLTALDAHGYPRQDIVITKAGEWLEGGIVKRPHDALAAADVVFVALHGAYGEDGEVQRLLERLHIPFTGSNSMPSSIAFNKELTKRTLAQHDVRMPKHRRITREELDAAMGDLQNIALELGDEVFVKPVSSGSSHGAQLVKDSEHLSKVLPELLASHDQVLVEEHINGKEATVGVLQDFRDESLNALPAIEIVPPTEHDFFNYENKYDGSTQEIVPGRFSEAERKEMQRIAKLVHDELRCDHYSRSDFLVKDGEVYFLEVNTLPGLTSESLFPKAAAAVGLEFNDLVKHLVETARV